VRHVLIAGGAGFIGSHLTDRLLARGCSVTVVDDLSTGSLANLQGVLDHPRFTYRNADVCDPGALQGIDTDVIFALASPASPVAYQSRPLATLAAGSAGTRTCLAAATDQGARMVLASTSEVYGDPLCHPQPESYWGNVNPIGERSMYDEAKRFAEALATAYRREHATNVGIVRIFNTYGPRMDPADGRAFPAFISAALRGEPLTVHGDGMQTRSLCYVDDLVAGLERMADSDHPGPINLGNPDERTILELAHAVIAACQSSSPVVFTERPPDDPSQRCPDITRAREVLGWEPRVPLAEGMLAMVAAYRAEVAQA